MKLHGGKRKGSGRKSLKDEQQTRDLCISALEKKYGSQEAAIQALLDSDSDTLKKFVYEHAYGKPKEEIGFIGKNVTIKVNAE